jgi:hypothetical protein
VQSGLDGPRRPHHGGGGNGAEDAHPEMITLTSVPPASVTLAACR